MRVLLFLLFPIFLSAQINRAYGVIEIGATFPTSSATGPKFAYRTVDSSFYRWVSGSTWVKVVEPSIMPDTLYLTESIGTSYKVSGDTINLTPYLLKSDTTSMLVRYIERGDTSGMLSSYIRSAGWGLLKSSYTLRADSTLLATRLFAKNLPTYITSGQVAYSNGSNLVGSPNHYWNNTDIRLGIGTNAPSHTVDIVKSSGSNYLRVFTNSNASGADSRIRVQSNTNDLVFADFGKFSTGTPFYKIINSGDSYLYNSASGLAGDMAIFNDNSSGRIKFAGGGRSNPDLIIHNNGNINIGTSATPSYILDINSTDALRLPRGTTAQRPTGALAILRGNTDNTSIEWYNGTRWATGLESTFARGTSTRVPFFDANGQVTESPSIYTTGGTGVIAQTFTHLDNASRTWGAMGVGSLLKLSMAAGGGNTYIQATNASSLRYQAYDAHTIATANGIVLYAGNVNGAYNSFKRSAIFGIPSAIGSGWSPVKNYNFFGSMVIANPNITTIAGLEADILTANSQLPNLYVMGKISLGVNGSGRPYEATRTFDVNGEVRIRDLVTTTPTGIVGRDADGVLSGITVSSDLKLASGTLGLKHKSLIDSLPLASVSIDASGNDLEIIGLNSLNLESESAGGIISSDGDITNITPDSEFNVVTGQDAALNLTDMVNLHAPNADGVNAFRIQSEGFFHNFVNTSADPDSAFSIITDGDRGLIKMHKYGNGYVDATYTGEYPGKYILATTANHNVMDYRIDRDTLVVDANFSVGTLLYYTQNLHINLRMTALAGTNSTITFPDAAEVFRGKSIYVRVLEKDPGIYVPVINVAGGVSRLLYTSMTTTAPADQANLTMDNATWPFFRTYKFTCLNTGTTPDYRWVLNQ